MIFQNIIFIECMYRIEIGIAMENTYILIHRHVDTYAGMYIQAYCHNWHYFIEWQMDQRVFWFAIDLVAKCISNYERQIDKTILTGNFVN